MHENEIDIRPSTSVYSTYQRMSYKTWYALAEFVDNSTASYWNNRSILRKVAREKQIPFDKAVCRVILSYDLEARRLVVEDNAFGMELEDFQRALILDRPPAVRGRNEFGMGLKTAACWFGTRWTVETTQYGSPRLYSATVDVAELVTSKRERVPYTVRRVDPSMHCTKIIIEDVLQPIVGRAHERVRDQLRSMFRGDLRSGEVQIVYQGKPLAYEDPELLIEEVSGGRKIWKQEVDIEIPWERTGGSLRVVGWVGIRKSMSRRDSGLVLMRYGRVIVGGPDNGYRPPEIFSATNTHEYARIVGELHLDEWPVNQAKDGFNWNDGLEDAFIKSLKDACKDVIQKARTHRLSPDESDTITASDMQASAEPIKQVINRPTFKSFTASELNHRPGYEHIQPSENSGDLTSIESDDSGRNTSLSTTQGLGLELGNSTNNAARETEAFNDSIEYMIHAGGDKWLMRLNWQISHPEQFWMSVQPPRPSQGLEPSGVQVVEITLNMAHPFLAPYFQSRASLDVLQRLVFALALSETMIRAQAGGARVDPGAIRTKMNDVLRYAAKAEME